MATPPPGFVPTKQLQQEEAIAATQQPMQPPPEPAPSGAPEGFVPTSQLNPPRTLQSRYDETLGEAKEDFRQISGFDVSPVDKAAMYASGGIQAAAGLATDTAAHYIPEAVKKGFIKAGTKAGQWIMENKDNPVIAAGLEKVKMGAAAWEAFKEMEPETARLLEAGVDIAGMLTPRSAAKPYMDEVLDTTAKKGRMLAKRGARQTLEDKTSRMQDILYPGDTIKGTGRAGEGDWTSLRSATYEPGPDEAEIVEAVSRVKGTDPGRTVRFNNGEVLKEVDTLDSRLQTLVRENNMSFDEDEFIQTLREGIDKLPEDVGFKALTPTAQKIAMDFAQDAEKLIEEHGSTAAGLLLARKQFDRIIRKANENAFNPDRASGLSVAHSFVRQKMNDKVAELVGPQVKDMLTEQHLLLKASTRMRDVMINEKENALKRLGHNLHRIGHLPSTPLALAALGQAAAPLLGPAAAMAGGAAGLYGLAKIAKSGNTKKVMGDLLNTIAQAIKTAKNQEMVQALKADRAVLLEVMRELDKEYSPPMKAAGNEQEKPQ